MKFSLRILGLAASLAILPPFGQAEPPSLIPREVLFGNPKKAGPHLSPNGAQVAYVANSNKGVANVWIETLGKNDARMVTHDSRRGIFSFQWAGDGKHILYRQDQNGDENWHLYSTDVQTGLIRDLTPFLGIRCQDILPAGRRGDELLVGLNIRDRRVSDMYRVNLNTGAITLEAQNPGDVISWSTDERGVIRACTAFSGDTAQTTIRVRDDVQAAWRDLLVIPFADCPFYGQVNGGTLVAGFAPDGRGLYVVYPLGEDKTRLAEVDLHTGKVIEVIAADPSCDVEYNAGLILQTPTVVTDPANGRVQAVGFNHTRMEWKVTDPLVRDDFRALAQVNDGTLGIIDRTKGDKVWLVQYDRPDAAVAYYLYDRPSRSAKSLFVDHPEFANYQFAPTEPVVVKSRDGLDLVCYLTLPPGIGRKNLPLILLPHGGPWWRDRWTFDGWVQLLANRGYAVLQVEYRGSTGFGKAFLNASNRQFGDQAVLADMLDAVKWTLDTGLADAHRLAVMGASGGGYATLCCIAYHPELEWRCAVDLVGPSSVRTLLESFPEYWKPVKRRWVLRMGDAEHDDIWNRKISPLFHAADIRTPLLMGYGLNDPRVHIREAEQMAKAMRDKGLPVTLVVYPDEGHGFARPENNMDFFGRMEDFLAQHLGGRKEPWRKLAGSSAEER